MSSSRHKARQCAVQALYQWQLTGQDVADIDRQFIEEHDMKGVKVDYFQELLHQVLLHLHELDDHMAPLLDRPVQEVDPVERAILRLGIYELKFRLDVPYRVVINEGVELAKTFGAEHGHKYVNSILDGVARQVRTAEIEAAKQSKNAK
ncbi:MAG: transcription antitermination factor NusB [Pseudomonadota bacterium]